MYRFLTGRSTFGDLSPVFACLQRVLCSGKSDEANDEMLYVWRIFLIFRSFRLSDRNFKLLDLSDFDRFGAQDHRDEHIFCLLVQVSDRSQPWVFLESSVALENALREVSGMPAFPTLADAPESSKRRHLLNDESTFLLMSEVFGKMEMKSDTIRSTKTFLNFFAFIEQSNYSEITSSASACLKSSALNVLKTRTEADLIPFGAEWCWVVSY